MLYLGGGLCFLSDQGGSMNEQTLFKKDWIFKTLDRMSEPERIAPDLIQAVFNIPLKDAQALLNEYRGGQV